METGEEKDLNGLTGYGTKPQWTASGFTMANTRARAGSRVARYIVSIPC